MLFPSVGGYMLKNTEAIICFILFSHQFSGFFPIIPIGDIRYICPI